ncbi:hypothetical protein ACOMHN_022658 [Nucella lapillus]
MASKLLFSVLLCVCSINVCHSWFWTNRQGCSLTWTEGEVKRCFQCKLLRTKNVTLVVRNILRDTNFEESVTLSCTRAKTLFTMMMEAAEVNTAFKFSVSYNHAGHPGFFVNAFNNVYSQWQVDQTWWQILDGNLNLTPVGASSYQPSDGETVTFNFTQGF